MTGFFFRCANPAAPSGGPKDTLSPVILSLVPNNFETNFNSEKIIIELNEYIKLVDVQKEIIIAPPMKKRPEFRARGRSIEITLTSELDSATTYKIDFGNSIQDNNESNVLRNFSYILSTDSYIDSLVMTGQMLSAETGDTIINGLVYLFNTDNDSLDVDSTVFIGNPLSVARTDSNGVFIATNLKNMDYLIYGIDDQNNNSSYDVGEDFIAFVDTVLNPAKMPPLKLWYNHDRETIEATPQFQFRTFGEKQKRRQNLTDMKRIGRGVLSFVFTADSARVDTFELEGIDSTLLFSEFNPTRDSLTVWIMQPDSVITDSLNGKISFHVLSSIKEDSIATKTINLFSKTPKKKERNLTADGKPIRTDIFSVIANVQQNKDLYDDIIFSFRKPLKDINKNIISLTKVVTEESASRGRRDEIKSSDPKEEKIENVEFEILRDSITALRCALRAKWEPNTKYTLKLAEGAFTDILTIKSDSTDFSFTTFNPEEYSVLVLDIAKEDSTKNYIIELINAKNTKTAGHVIKFAKMGKDTLDYIPPGNYIIKVIEDRNGNGKWDTGHLLNRVLPEETVIFKDDKGLSIFEMKANWEVEHKINVEQLFKSDI